VREHSNVASTKVSCGNIQKTLEIIFEIAAGAVSQFGSESHCCETTCWSKPRMACSVVAVSCLNLGMRRAIPVDKYCSAIAYVVLAITTQSRPGCWAEGGGPDRHQRMLFAPKSTQRIGARRAPGRRQDSHDTNNHQHCCRHGDVEGIQPTRREHHAAERARRPDRQDASHRSHRPGGGLMRRSG
jgi:hypothetical protein